LLCSGERVVGTGAKGPTAQPLTIVDLNLAAGVVRIEASVHSGQYVPPPDPVMVGQETPKSRNPSFADKCKGVPGERSPPRVPWVQVLVSGVTAFLGILAIAGPLQLRASDDVFMLLGSFGATAALVYGAPEAALSQPRNVFGGHVVSAFTGVCVYRFGEAVNVGIWLTAPLSVSIAVVIMQLTRTLHPPGAATSLIGVLGSADLHKLGFQFIVTPAAVGAAVMIFIAVIGNNLSGVRRYPKYWW
jgi:hypothetical protein